MNEPGRQTGLIRKRSRLLGERPVAPRVRPLNARPRTPVDKSIDTSGHLTYPRLGEVANPKTVTTGRPEPADRASSRRAGAGRSSCADPGDPGSPQARDRAQGG